MNLKVLSIVMGLLLSLCGYRATAKSSEQNVEWKAKWISSGTTREQPNTWLNFRKEVNLPNVPTSVIARIGADSKYWLWINGKPVVFEGGLKRGPNPLDTYYDEVEIAPYLKRGENTIAVLLWYFGRPSFSHNDSGKAGLLFDCQTPSFDILSDDSWKCEANPAYGTCPPPDPNMRLAESNIRYDACKAVFAELAPLSPGTSENVQKNPNLYEVRTPAAPTVYCECEFHDTVEGAKWIVEHTTEIGEAIAKGLCKYLGVKFVPAQTQKPAEEPKADTEQVLYRVQVGAFAVRANADRMLEKLKAAGFAGFVVKGKK